MKCCAFMSNLRTTRGIVLAIRGIFTDRLRVGKSPGYSADGGLSVFFNLRKMQVRPGRTKKGYAHLTEGLERAT